MALRRASVVLLLLAAACSEPASVRPPPRDAFAFPSGLALASSTKVAGGQALLVASANADLRWGPKYGGTLISVDPDPYTPAGGVAHGSLGAPDGLLDVLGSAEIGSYAGPVTVADAASCPGLASPAVMVASRFTGRLHRFPLQGDASLGTCADGACEVLLDKDLGDPYAVAVACRPDGVRRSAYVSYLRAPVIGAFAAGTAWLSELDLDDPTRPIRTFALAAGPISDMAYDESFDRLYAVGRFVNQSAPLFILDLQPCRVGADSCLTPGVHVLDLFTQVRGAELQAVALSNPSAGPRRAYVSARLYDADLARSLGGRPTTDIGGVLLVLDLSEDASGAPRVLIDQVVDIGLGAGQVRVLPPRPGGLRDLVVVSSSTAGTVTVYDDATGAVAAVVAVDPRTGAPLAGREPFGLAVQDRTAVDGSARVFVAAYDLSTVSAVDVPLATPALARLLTESDGAPLRIGKERL
ncbi:MAG TPA: hypothetical protein VFP50_10050 [Anaeromyxobacteraceae bacterium]|nr:hypothetical protein [Anaeromyxobacteraceae bacterium]